MEFQHQGSDPRHSCDLSRSCLSAGSLAGLWIELLSQGSQEAAHAVASSGNCLGFGGGVVIGVLADVVIVAVITTIATTIVTVVTIGTTTATVTAATTAIRTVTIGVIATVF